jgi:hypothetical protein
MRNLFAAAVPIAAAGVAIGVSRAVNIKAE